MQRVIRVICFLSWLLCGCSIDQICDDPKAAVIFVVAVLVTLACAKVMGGRHD